MGDVCFPFDTISCSPSQEVVEGVRRESYACERDREFHTLSRVESRPFFHSPPQLASPSAMLSRQLLRPSTSSLYPRMASQRVNMISSHLSSSASSSSPSKPPADTPQPPVLFEAQHSLRKVVLNRPKALNSLNDEMVDLILPQLSKFEQSDLANVVIIKSNSKHFCAGGDVVCGYLVLSSLPRFEWN